MCIEIKRNCLEFLKFIFIYPQSDYGEFRQITFTPHYLKHFLKYALQPPHKTVSIALITS